MNPKKDTINIKFKLDNTSYMLLDIHGLGIKWHFYICWHTKCSMFLPFSFNTVPGKSTLLHRSANLL